MGDYYSDKHAGGESYAQHRELARSNERIRKSLSPSNSTAAGSSASDSGGGLGLLAFAGIGMAWYNWDQILISMTQTANDLIGALLQNWFWLSAFPLGILFLLLGFAKRVSAWRSRAKFVPEFLMLLGTALLILGEMDSGYGDKIIWYSPFVMGVASSMVLSIFILKKEQPERFAINRQLFNLIKRLIALPFLAMFASFAVFFIASIIAVYGFEVVNAQAAESILFTAAYITSWPLCFYLVWQQQG